MLLDALTLSLGYNATLVTLGASLLGFAAGVTGTGLTLGRRALLSDALAHATLPGVAAAFLVMVALGGDGRWLPGLLLGAGLAAGLGAIAIAAIAARTRLGEDAATAAVLSVAFGIGVVLLTVVQQTGAGRQAGLDGFLLGAAAGMLRAEALTIAAGGILAVAAAWALRRPVLHAAFDPVHAATLGIDPQRTSLAVTGLALAVTLIGLKVVGLVLIVALLVIPPAAARFWTARGETMALAAGLIGAAAGWIGSALSAAAPGLPTGPLVVLAAFALFLASLVLGPHRGLVARARARWAGRSGPP
jgi:manganese/zinc/iron transport system permease protein